MENLFNTLNTVNITTNIKTYNKENYFQLLKKYENKSDIIRVNLNTYDIIQEMKNIKNHLYINNMNLNNKYDLEKVDNQIDLIINTINDLFFPKVNVNKIKKIGRI